MIDSISSEFESIIFGFVQSDHVGHSKMLKYLNVVFRPISSLGVARLRVNRAHKRNELIWNDPV